MREQSYSRQQSHFSLQAQSTFRQTPFDRATLVKGAQHSSSVVPQGQQEYKLRAGDTLWGIAQKELGDGSQWHELQKPNGSHFTEQEARKLQIGSSIYIPEQKATSSFHVKPYTQGFGGNLHEDPHKGGSNSHATQLHAHIVQQVSSRQSTQHAAFYPTKTPINAVTAKQTHSDHGVADHASNDDQDSKLNLNRTNISQSVAVNAFNAREPLEPAEATKAVNTSNDIAKTGDRPLEDSRKRVSGKPFKNGVAERIRNDPSHPLRFMLDKDGNLSSRYQGGHGHPFSSGRRQTLGIEDKDLNHSDQTRVRKFLEIGGEAVEEKTAEQAEQEGYLPRGTVENARSHPGWIKPHTTRSGRVVERGLKVNPEGIKAAEKHLDPEDVEKLRQKLPKPPQDGFESKPQPQWNWLSPKDKRLHEAYGRALRASAPIANKNSHLDEAKIQEPSSKPSRLEGQRSDSAQSNSSGTQIEKPQSTPPRSESPTSLESPTSRARDSQPRLPDVATGEKFPKIPNGLKTGLKVTSKVAGRVLKPLGLALDAYQLGDAIHKDGGIGENTKQVLKEDAISWGSTVAGAGVGFAVAGPPGAVVGGIVGGLAPVAVSFVKGWFD